MSDRLIVTLLVASISFYAGYQMRDSMDKTEAITPAPEKRQRDDSLILERDPSPPPPLPHKLPAGAKEERRVSVTVNPVRKPTKISDTTKKDVSVECPPVRIDLSLIQYEGGKRVVASSPDGKVIGGIDIPITGTIIPKPLPWSVGVSYDPFKESAGLWVERDIGRFRAGLDLYQHKSNNHSEAAIRLRIGWRF